MIEVIEKAIRRCHCKDCHNEIKVGELRGVGKTFYYNNPTIVYYCVECTKKALEKRKKELNKLCKKILEEDDMKTYNIKMSDLNEKDLKWIGSNLYARKKGTTIQIMEMEE